MKCKRYCNQAEFFCEFVFSIAFMAVNTLSQLEVSSIFARFIYAVQYATFNLLILALIYQLQAV